MQELNEQLLEELSAKQQDSSQFAALQDQLTRATHRLELEASGRAELWQRCAALEQELQTEQDKLAVATKSLKRAEQQLGEWHAVAGLGWGSSHSVVCDVLRAGNALEPPLSSNPSV